MIEDYNFSALLKFWLYLRLLKMQIGIGILISKAKCDKQLRQEINLDSWAVPLFENFREGFIDFFLDMF